MLGAPVSLRVFTETGRDHGCMCSEEVFVLLDCGCEAGLGAFWELT